MAEISDYRRDMDTTHTATALTPAHAARIAMVGRVLRSAARPMYPLEIARAAFDLTGDRDWIDPGMYARLNDCLVPCAANGDAVPGDDGRWSAA